MTEPTKQPAEIIVVTRARLAFARIHTAVEKKDQKGNVVLGKDGKPIKVFSCTLLIDPSSTEGQANIKAIKQAALKPVEAKWGKKAEGGWPKVNPATGLGGLIMCFGNGNDLPKVYDGYKDMFYVKLSDTSRPLLGNFKGQPVVDGDPECPFSGCYVRARISPWIYFPTPQKPQSASGVNFNFRSLQYVADGPGFGGGGSRSAEEEFDTQMAGDAPAGNTAVEDEPF